jgi:pimeloyl-ACP methyl ester carboxylesterase
MGPEFENDDAQPAHGADVKRRVFTLSLAAGAVCALLPCIARSASSGGARNIVLVHGLFADGSCWSEVIPRLQAHGLNVTSVQNPLTTFEEAVASAQRVVARQDGPTVLVGHSFSGMIVSEVGVDAKVSAVVYVAARAPDVGEDYTTLAKRFPAPPASAGIVFDGDEGRLTEAAFLRDFAGDLPPERAKVLYATQMPSARHSSRASPGTPPGDRSRASMPYRNRTARSIRTCSGSWPSA